MPITTYLVEDHPVVREMVREFLGIDPDLEVLGAAASGEEALVALATLEVDIVLVDASLPGMSGLELVEELRRTRPALSCVIYSGYDDDAHVRDALVRGARGYLLKNGNPAELLEGVRRVASGGTYLGAGIDPVE